jgi:predicted ArsR family transcriptional regulator
VTPADLEVLRAITDQEGVSVTQMCARLGRSRAAMRRHLARLVAAGVLRSQPRGLVKGARVLYRRAQ